MKYLNLKLLRDFKKNWMQFFSVFLMSLLSVLIFVGLQGAWNGLDVSLNRFINQSNLADAWVTSTGFNDNDLTKINNINGINKIEEKNRIQVQDVSTKNQESKYLYLDTFTSGLTKPKVIAGKNFSNNSKGIWVNKEYLNENKLSIGDTLNVEFLGKVSSLEILGIVQSADRIYYTGTEEYIAPNYSNYGYGYISNTLLKNTFNYQGLPNIIEIDYKEGTDEDIRETIENILGERLVSFYNRSTLVDVSDALDRVNQIKNLSFLFSFIFILLAILSMYTTIRRLIETQINEIALLKALGFSSFQIGLHYTSFGFIIGGIGVMVGAVISPFMSWFVLNTQKDMFSIPKWSISYSSSSLALMIFVLTICVLSSYLASRNAIKGLPADFLRGDSQKKKHNLLIEHFPKVWKLLNYEQRWAIRDTMSNKARLLMGIFGVSGGMMLLIAGIGMPQSINHLVNKAYHNDFTYDYRLHINDYNKTKETYKKGQWVQINQAHFTPDDGYNRLLIIISEGNYINMKTIDGKGIESDGIYITEGFAKRANLSVGQELQVKPYSTSNNYKFKIRGIITSETNQGAYITQELFEKVHGNFNPSTLLVNSKDYETYFTNDANINSIIPMKSQESNATNFVNSLMSIFLMIIGFAILLVVIVLYNLGSLSFIERSRDYATLCVLGFSKKEIRNITMIENIVTTVVGWLIGIPMGIWFLNTYVNTFSTIRLEYTSYVTPSNILLSSVIVIICSMSTTLFISRRINKLDMVQALKGV